MPREYQMKKTAEQIADAVLEKVAIPRWEQMARKFPEILEGKDLLKYRLRSYLQAKDKWNALYPRTPTRDARAMYDRDFFPKDIRDFNRGLNSDDLFNLRGRSQIAPLKYPYPELKNTPFQERALEAYKKLPLEEGGLTRAERIRELWKRDRPISSMRDKALYQPESDFVHATRPILSTL